ncbi:MAG TPA: hypothetical protein VEF90_12395, partial [Xanthobacteraceae bacterium]|nr:hypothetical protein [Xanthobacteraceae bacterium]
EEVAHIDAGAQNAGRSEFGHDLLHGLTSVNGCHDMGVAEFRSAVATAAETDAAFNRYHGSSSFGEDAFCRR